MRWMSTLQWSLCGLTHGSATVINLLIAEVRGVYSSGEYTFWSEDYCFICHGYEAQHLFLTKTDSILSIFPTHIPHPRCTQTQAQHSRSTPRYSDAPEITIHGNECVNIVHVHQYSTPLLKFYNREYMVI